MCREDADESFGGRKNSALNFSAFGRDSEEDTEDIWYVIEDNKMKTI